MCRQRTKLEHTGERQRVRVQSPTLTLHWAHLSAYPHILMVALPMVLTAQFEVQSAEGRSRTLGLFKKGRPVSASLTPVRTALHTP